MTDRVITARNLTVTYRTHQTGFPFPGRERTADVEALKGVSFDVGRGEAFGVIGRNGAGKSTLLRVLAKTLIPDAGSVDVVGRTSTLLALGVGFNPDLSGHRNIILGSLAAGLTMKQAEEIQPSIVDYAELGGAIDRPLSTYSRGQQSRLAFAIARNLNPDVLLIDEVLAVGDEAFKQKTLADMRQLLSRSGTIVFVSHALGIIREFCDRVLWLDEGETMQIGEPNQIVDAYRSRFVRPEFDLVRDVTGGRDGVPAEMIRTPRPTPSDVHVDQLRLSRTADAGPDYADLDPLLTLRRAGKRGRRALASGWKATGKKRLHIEAPFHWEQHDDARIDAWDPVGLLLAAYQHDGFERMLHPATDYAIDWIQTHQPDPLGDGFWAAELIGVRTHRLAGLIEKVMRVPSVKDDVVAQLVASAIEHAAILEDPAGFDPESLASFDQIAGMIALARTLPELSEVQKLARVAAERLEATLATQFTADGVHRRHSPLRHMAATKKLGTLLSTGLVDTDTARTALKKAERALEWFVTPTGHLAGFGDIDPEPISEHWQADGLPVGDQKRLWSTGGMRHASTAGRIGREPPTAVRGFKKGGYFVVKTRGPSPAHLAMQCGFHSDAGKEADDLSITWHDKGRDLLVDAGRYRGDDDAFRDYSISTRAHNTIEIDGHDHDVDRPKYRSALGGFGSIGSVHYGIARVKIEEVIARRALVYEPGSWLLVFDTLRNRGDAPGTYRQWFHAAPDLDIQPTDLGLVLADDDGAAVHVASLFESEALDPVRGSLENPTQGWHSPGIDVVIPNWAFGYVASSSDAARFATVFSLDGPITNVLSSPGKGAGRGELGWSIAGRPIRVEIDFRETEPVKLT